LNANRKIIRTAFFTAVFVLGMPGPVRADVVFIGGVDMGGTGFGNVNTIMTMQALGQQMGSIESGCVGVSDQGRLSTTVQWLNTHNQTDSDLCQGGNIGGFEKPPSDFPHNQTFKISDAAKLVVVFNSDQPAGGSVSLKNLVFVLFNANGQVGFTSGATSQVFSSTRSEPGIGNSGWEFTLNATQRAAAQAAINAGYDFFGLSATVTDSTGGPETFFLLNAPGVVPEPATLLLLGTGVCLFGGLLRRRLLPTP
jgi:PEP-CTERM motif